MINEGASKLPTWIEVPWKAAFAPSREESIMLDSIVLQLQCCGCITAPSHHNSILLQLHHTRTRLLYDAVALTLRHVKTSLL